MFGIGSLIGSVVSSIGTFVSSVGSAIVSGIGKLATAIMSNIDNIVKVVDAVCQIIGIFCKDDNVEDIGAAMRQCDKKPEDFDSINSYIDYLKEEIKQGRVDLNEEKNPTQKFADMAMGCGLAIKAIDEKYGLQTSPEFWNFSAKKFNEGKLDGNDVESLLKNSSEKKIDTEDIKNYVEGNKLEGDKNPSEISTCIKDSLKEANPNLSDAEITDKFNNLMKKD